MQFFNMRWLFLLIAFVVITDFVGAHKYKETATRNKNEKYFKMFIETERGSWETGELFKVVLKRFKNAPGSAYDIIQLGFANNSFGSKATFSTGLGPNKPTEKPDWIFRDIKSRPYIELIRFIHQNDRVTVRSCLHVDAEHSKLGKPTKFFKDTFDVSAKGYHPLSIHVFYDTKREEYDFYVNGHRAHAIKMPSVISTARESVTYVTEKFIPNLFEVYRSYIDDKDTFTEDIMRFISPGFPTPYTAVMKPDGFYIGSKGMVEGFLHGILRIELQTKSKSFLLRYGEKFIYSDVCNKQNKTDHSKFKHNIKENPCKENGGMPDDLTMIQFANTGDYTYLMADRTQVSDIINSIRNNEAMANLQNTFGCPLKFNGKIIRVLIDNEISELPYAPMSITDVEIDNEDIYK